MNKKFKLFCQLLAVIILLSGATFFALHIINRDIVNSTPDMSEWVLSNESYILHPVLTDETISFYVENKNGEVVFECRESWRLWDFKSLSIDENSVITADSADTGTYYYKTDMGTHIHKENGNGAFYLAEPNSYDE